MKFKTSSSQIRDNYDKIIGAGYCSMQSLLKYQYPIAYSSGLYGWNCDYYDIDGIIICTGYRNILHKNTKIDYKTFQQYERKASEINNNYDLDYDVRKNKVNRLLKRLISKA